MYHQYTLTTTNTTIHAMSIRPKIDQWIDGSIVQYFKKLLALILVFMHSAKNHKGMH